MGKLSPGDDTAFSVSVCMCTFNGERFLETQLQSILNQTQKPYELVICDDGSTDGTTRIIEKFARIASFPVRLYKNSTTLGYAANFDRAISLCDGTLIALSDQDDIWYPHKLQRQASILLNNFDIGGVFSDGDLLYAATKHRRTLWKSIGFRPQKQRRMMNGAATEVLLHENVVTGMTLIFRSSLRNTLLPIPKGWIHDAWLAWMLSLHSQLYPCPDRLVGYRVHESQQVGVPLGPIHKLKWTWANGLGAYFRQARIKSLRHYGEVATQLEDLIKHLRGESGDSNTKLLQRVANKARYARSVGSALAQPRFKRFPKICIQAPLYFRYSPVPMRALIRDLVI
jgi:glycosyltransferase involved in cell wall biosynthesis